MIRTKLLAFSGRKSSAKTTVAEFLQRESKRIWGETADCRVYYFADELKRVCSDLLGIPAKLCWGSEDDKNQLTDILWENLPHYEELRQKAMRESLQTADFTCNASENERAIQARYEVLCPKGRMTVRQVLQHVGTEIFRRMCPGVWIDSLLRKIKREAPTHAIIADMRFPDEGDAVLAEGGSVYRLTRCVHHGDNHASEIAMDDYPRFTAVFDNANMSLEQQEVAIRGYFSERVAA